VADWECATEPDTDEIYGTFFWCTYEDDLLLTKTAERAKRLTALLNGDLAGACGMTKADLANEMLNVYHDVNGFPSMERVLDVLSQLIRKEVP
jgi:hypothetical protein